MIEFRCTCGKTLRAKEEYAGRVTQCPACGAEMPVPAAGPGAEAAYEEAPARRPRAGVGRRKWDDEAEDPGAAAGQAKMSGKALTSFILGLASFLCSIFAAVPSIIFGIMGLRDISRSRGRLQGQGFAIAGMVLSAASVVMCLPIMIGLLLPAVQKVREAANRMQSSNNLKQLGLAMHNYHHTYNTFPPPVVYSMTTGKPLYSWRVLLLPFVDEPGLYKQLNLNEPWDSPQNKPLLAARPRVYTSMHRQENTPDGTFYQVFVGKGATFEDRKLTRFADITDGLSNTLMIVEAANEVPWASPQDIPYQPNQPVLPLLCGQRDLGFNACFADGSVRYILKSVSDRTLHMAITRAGNEVFNPNTDLPGP